MDLHDIYEEDRRKFWCKDGFDTWKKGCINRINNLFETDYDMNTPDDIIIRYLVSNEPYENKM